MYEVLTSPANEDVLETVLLNNESDYWDYIKDNNFVNQDGKKIMFGKPRSYPTILVTHFSASFNRFCDHRVFGEYIDLLQLVPGHVKNITWQ